MHPVASTGFSTLLALLTQPEGTGSSIIHPPDAASLLRVFIRWLHFVAGITWIGLLYFFNLINIRFMNGLDARTRNEVVPALMPRALWWFRWGALVTVFAGWMYYGHYILNSEARSAGLSVWGTMGKWFLIVLVAYALIHGLLQPASGALNKGWILAVLIGIVVVAMSVVIVEVLGAPSETGQTLGNKSLSIGIGGGLGIIMLLNVWGIIWRAQKRLITWARQSAEEDTPIPAQAEKLARRAFLALRVNFWLSFPMLFFMALSHGDYVWFAR